MDLSSNVRHLLVVDCSENMPLKPPLWWEKAEDRIEWSYIRYQRQMENLEWLDDNTIPYLTMITGTEIFAEALGCQVYRPADNNPCAIPLVTNIHEVSKIRFPKVCDTRLIKLFDMADTLKARAGQDALLSFPDLQTPMDILALLWDKSDLLIQLYEEPGMVKELAHKIKGFLFEFLDLWISRYGPEFIAHYPDYYMSSGITISEDEIGIVSQEFYHEFFEEELRDLAERYGKIGVHCCADSQHQWDNFKRIPNLKLLNLVRPTDQLEEACQFFDGTAPLYIQDHLDLQAPPELHLAHHTYTATREQSLKIVDFFQQKYMV